MSPTDAVPTISRRLADGRLVELVYDPDRQATALAIHDPDGATHLVPEVSVAGGERLIPYAATNNLIATGCVLLPSEPVDYGDKAQLLADIRTYLRRYVDLSPAFEGVAAHYALFSWVYEAFSEAPYLRFRGDYGTGKTRALLALGSICYKPFFASGASTVSPIFHVLDAFQGTLVLDEADFRFTDATASLTKVLNNGNAVGLPVLRSVANRHKEYSPRAFRVFGPKLVGMRERFGDEALESRFLTEETGLRPLRDDIPLATPADLQTDALILRNKLLMWRFRNLNVVASDPSRAAPDVEPRLNQTALPLLSLMDDLAVRGALQQRLALEQARLRADRAGAPEARVLVALSGLFASATPGAVPISAVVERLNAEGVKTGSQTVTAKWMGWFLRTRLRLTTLRTRGVYVIPSSEAGKVEALARRFGVAAGVVDTAP
ncbi:hypothetical protein Q0812_11920 [Brevundimonas sp. 2R-24]|uniref:Uncharacterized protein n=1 Tax=Peiella sedimenti TaxID=3061083 RepID=A0ABT8SQ43_9CAUL|nr:hypothetical protein [Caulobacteraceae bacterium XZ-24]